MLEPSLQYLILHFHTILWYFLFLITVVFRPPYVPQLIPQAPGTSYQHRYQVTLPRLEHIGRNPLVLLSSPKLKVVHFFNKGWLLGMQVGAYEFLLWRQEVVLNKLVYHCCQCKNYIKLVALKFSLCLFFSFMKHGQPRCRKWGLHKILDRYPDLFRCSLKKEGYISEFVSSS